ncbi:hypothetical protein B0H19DRAFT_1298790 [Mycena capillaripes]|nr:hypothetical protein B0H19DRAFT_1298790 [Mycena capillaripes]
MLMLVMGQNLKSKKPPACDRCKVGQGFTSRLPVLTAHAFQGSLRLVLFSAKWRNFSTLWTRICTTTLVPRDRPRKRHKLASVSRAPSERSPSLGPEPTTDCPEFTSDFVANCFESLKFTTQYEHPLILNTSITVDARAVSFQLDQLPPQSRVLALCIVCCGSLTTFHPSALGEGTRPESFTDSIFFSSMPSVLKCGIRCAHAYRALRAKALKAAWDAGIILNPSNENAASYYLLDLLEQFE